MIPAYICDLDGTLANCNHRLHHVQNGKKDWDKFFAGIPEDTIYKDVSGVLEALEDPLAMRDPYRPVIIFVTARPEEYRPSTQRWLDLHFWNNRLLVMRKSGDYRPDYIIKEEILKELQQHYEILGVFDDRPSVCEMWRRNGLTVFQVHSENWDESKKTAHDHILGLMVGPSGAGKSTYIKNLRWGSDEIFETDDLRFHLTGDRADQTRNEDVFHYLHAIIKARCETGQSTLVDATNIRNADRKKILSLAQPNTRIHYYVVDRPLKDKLLTRGDRPDTLVIKHHNTFQSNLKDILNGDGDPRVKVIDTRTAAGGVKGA